MTHAHLYGQTVIIDPATVDVCSQELLMAKWVIIASLATKHRCFLGTFSHAMLRHARVVHLRCLAAWPDARWGVLR